VVFHRGRVEKARLTRVNENLYYECIYDLLQKPTDFPNFKTSLNYFKAKIVRIYSRRAQTLQLDTSNTTLSPEERTSPYHLLEMQKQEGDVDNNDNGPDRPHTHSARDDSVYLRCVTKGWI
jgi:hypothetical protein